MSESTLEPGEVVDSAQSLKPAAGGVPPGVSRSSVVFARLLVGLIILICAEVFHAVESEAVR